jgi:hypothetical protein
MVWLAGKCVIRPSPSSRTRRRLRLASPISEQMPFFGFSVRRVSANNATNLCPSLPQPTRVENISNVRTVAAAEVAQNFHPTDHRRTDGISPLSRNGVYRQVLGCRIHWIHRLCCIAVIRRNSIRQFIARVAASHAQRGGEPVCNEHFVHPFCTGQTSHHPN